MENEFTKEITYISNKNATEKTTIIYDILNNRVNEKRISYQLVRDKSKYIITDRSIYTYSSTNNIVAIFEIEKGPTDREGRYTDDNEYTSAFYRTIKKSYLHSHLGNQIDIEYIRLNSIPFYKKPFCQILLRLEQVKSKDRYFDTNLRVASKIQLGNYFEYQYCKNDPLKLLNIVEYRIIANLTFINRLLNLIGIVGLFRYFPAFIWKRKLKDIKEDLPNGNEKLNKRVHNYANYICAYHDVILHESIKREDLFLKIKAELDSLILHNGV